MTDMAGCNRREVVKIPFDGMLAKKCNERN
jgi:hypothetical protein